MDPGLICFPFHRISLSWEGHTGCQGDLADVVLAQSLEMQ